MPAATIDFWFELASTYSYPAALRVQELADRAGVQVRYRAFLLGPIFAAQGWSDSPFNLYPVKGTYMWRDLERICEGLGLPFKRPTTFPRGSLPGSRIACAFADAPWVGAFVRALYTANFADDRDIREPAVVGEVLGELGLDGAALLGAAGSDDAKRRLREQTDEAQRLGIFGSPSFRVGPELFWGNDRLEAAVEWAQRRSP
jgi:2-hydroxychromene-2-carboxylate isomerase